MNWWHKIKRLFLAETAPTRSALPVQSQAIEIARVLCIMGMVYAHVWTGRTSAYIIAHSTTDQGMLRWFVVEMIGRSSVPLLGMVSGWLVGSSALRRSYWRFALGKARTVLAPMLLWNALAVFLILGAAYLQIIRGPGWKGWGWVLGEVTAFSRFNELNVQMPFLRDLFVCMLIAPLVVRLRSAWLIVLLMTVLVWTVATWFFPLVLRPQVALFFVIGIAARRWGWADYVGRMPFGLAALPFLLLAPVKFALSVWGYYFGREEVEIVTAVEMAMRVSAAMLMWRISMALVGKPIAIPIMRIEPYAFLLFCSHEIMIWLASQKIGSVTGPLDAPGWPIFFLLNPLLVLCGTLVLGKLLVELAPWAANWLSGGRLNGRPAKTHLIAQAV